MTQTAINIRHNGFGVDIIGGEANVDMAMLALNTQPDLLAALKAMRHAFDWEGARPRVYQDALRKADQLALSAIAKAEGN